MKLATSLWPALAVLCVVGRAEADEIPAAAAESVAIASPSSVSAPSTAAVPPSSSVAVAEASSVAVAEAATVAVPVSTLAVTPLASTPSSVTKEPYYAFAMPLLNHRLNSGDMAGQGDSNRNGFGLRLGLGRQLSERARAEVGLFAQGQGNSNSQYGVQVDGLRVWSIDDDTRWHALLGLGWLQSQSSGQQKSQGSVQTGVGIHKATPYTFGIRGDLRLITALGSGSDNSSVQAGFGLEFPLIERRLPIVDQDNDGVIDGRDECPNTPPETTVNGRGCEQEEVAPLSDGDEDGVPDVYDDCPDSTAKATVDRRGCEPKVRATLKEAQQYEPVVKVLADQDGDNVADGLDRCPNTAAGLKVDSQGCVISQSTVLPTVTFVPGSDELTEAAQKTLDAVVTTLKTQPDLRLEIAGHTDNMGPENANLFLSQKRAIAVRAHLTNAGIESSRLTTEGYGEFAPIADNRTEAGRQQNRRVEFRVVRR